MPPYIQVRIFVFLSRESLEMFVIMQHVINLDDEGVEEFCLVQKIGFCLSIEILSNNLLLISNKILKIQGGSQSLDINFLRGFI